MYVITETLQYEQDPKQSQIYAGLNSIFSSWLVV